MTKELIAGSRAPDFNLPDSEGDMVSLADFRGKWLVLYFYPKDNTSGCTTEAMEFTVKIDTFKKLNALVVGISPDSCQSHQKFMLKHDLGIRLLSDTEKVTLKKYSVWQKKKMYGKEHYGVVRSTFLINPEGTITRIWRKVLVKGHTDEVLQAIREIK